jgi:hypothetical protein
LPRIAIGTHAAAYDVTHARLAVVFGSVFLHLRLHDAASRNPPRGRECLEFL